ncbi:hypothetical protein O3P69_001487 [Scylla paramamosain]|uniref:Uncharacterized protein n=1 Tax=Scylla paramamosain TaxID=85552 RepID=A0AAW0V0A6_SCYPA
MIAWLLSITAPDQLYYCPRESKPSDLCRDCQVKTGGALWNVHWSTRVWVLSGRQARPTRSALWNICMLASQAITWKLLCITVLGPLHY